MNLTVNLFESLQQRLANARDHHSSCEWRGQGLEWALDQFLNEVDEVCRAANHGNTDLTLYEIGDCIIVGLRILKGEYK